ncbi:hypothetical protein IPM65_04415 [Candidatus Roizmanbacteria bacterium]|nr:MAG: hypothetical protein IPM65_04415 [Candidatus Roizmanbacteria bacterium]
MGKEKIKPLLDEYCLQEGISTISESTIGKVIKDTTCSARPTGSITIQQVALQNGK